MTEPRYDKPLPVPSDLAAPFWAALRQKQLVLQQCRNCAHHNHPPKYMCPRCYSDDLAWEPVAEQGTLYSYSVVHRAPTPAFKGDVPYAVGLVDIDGTSVRLLANILAPADSVAVGQRMQVVFDDVTDDFSLFRFKPAAEG